jgi:hypothetical protein
VLQLEGKKQKQKKLCHCLFTLLCRCALLLFFSKIKQSNVPKRPELWAVSVLRQHYEWEPYWDRSGLHDPGDTLPPSTAAAQLLRNRCSPELLAATTANDSPRLPLLRRASAFSLVADPPLELPAPNFRSLLALAALQSLPAYPAHHHCGGCHRQLQHFPPQTRPWASICPTQRWDLPPRPATTWPGVVALCTLLSSVCSMPGILSG